MPVNTASPRLSIANRRNGGWWRHLLRVAGAGLGLGITSAAMAAVLVYTALAHDLPRLDAFENIPSRPQRTVLPSITVPGAFQT